VRRSALVLAGLAVTVFFGYLAVRHVDPASVRRAIADSDPWWLVPALAVFAVSIVLRAWRWQLLFAPDARPPFGAVTRALFVGYVFNNLLPARAGEAARIVALREEASTPRAETLATVVIERVFDVASLLVLLFAAAPFLPAVSWLGKAGVVAGVAALALVLLVLALSRWEERAIAVAAWPLRQVPRLSAERIEFAVRHVLRGIVAVRRRDVAAAAAAVTIASWLVMAVSFWILMRAFALDVGPGAGLLVVVTVNLSLALPASPAGLGLFEAAAVLALHAYDVSQSEALSYALVLHAMNFAPLVLVGGIIVLRHPLLRGALAQREEGAGGRPPLSPP
jgi:glycosyltransferase 2 family protein